MSQDAAILHVRAPRGDPDPATATATKSRLMTQLVRKYERGFKDLFGRQVIHLLKTYKICGVNKTCIRPARVKILVMTLRHKSLITRRAIKSCSPNRPNSSS
jgi:hypothetical protein